MLNTKKIQLLYENFFKKFFSYKKISLAQTKKSLMQTLEIFYKNT